MDSTSDVIVLGAGASGLAAAERLLRAGLRVTVLEARDRLCGRVETVHDDVSGVPLELGAEFVHGKPKGLLKLARRARVKVRPCLDEHLLFWRGQYQNGAAAFDFTESLAAARPPDRPVGELLRERARAEKWPPSKLAFALGYVEGFYAARPDTASALAIGRMEKAAMDMGGITPMRVMEGYARALRPLTDALLRRPGTVFLNAVARDIRWAPGRVEVRAFTREGAPLGRFRAPRLVVTLPVGVLQAKPPEPGAVRFIPRIPEKERAWSRLEMGPIVKVLLRFRSAFWREHEHTAAYGFFQAPGQALPVFWALTPRETNHLVGWCGGPMAEELSGLDEREVLRRALDTLARLFRLTRPALHELLESWRIQDWQREPFTRGGYAVIPAGATDALEALAPPVEGTLFFAGEATNTEGEEGTVHGALDTGWRAAREVLAHARR